MSRCASHGELVGGYVLGALERSEMDEMRDHVAACPTCGPEARRMASLPGLLDTVQPGDVPPPAAAPEVEEAILDRFVRERRPRVAPRRRLLIAAVAATVVVVAVSLLVVLPADERESRAYASARLAPVEAASRARATAYVDAVPAGTRVTLGARGLVRDGAAYELWCVRSDGKWVSGGTFRSAADGRARAQLTAAVKPGDYHVIVITRASDDGARGTPVLRGELRY
jgi:hypothetical protein